MKKDIAEIAVVYLGSIALLIGGALTIHTFVYDFFSFAVIAYFLLVPGFAADLRHRKPDPLRITRSSFFAGITASAILLPLTAVAYAVYATQWLSLDFVPDRSAYLHTPLRQSALIHIALIALPEEYFYRAYLQQRLEHLLRPASAVVIASLLFAAAHFVSELNPMRLNTFFPGLLFGVVFRKFGLPAAVILHAAANLSMILLSPHFS